MNFRLEIDDAYDGRTLFPNSTAAIGESTR